MAGASAGASGVDMQPPEPGQPTLRLISIAHKSGVGVPAVTIHASPDHPFELRSTAMKKVMSGKATLKMRVVDEAAQGVSVPENINDHTLCLKAGVATDGLDTPVLIDTVVCIYVDNKEAAWSVLGNWVPPRTL
jgi:hypothetical protein